MTVIPTGYAELTFNFAGTDLRYPAAMTLGVDIGSYGGSPSDAAELAFNAFAGGPLSNLPSGISLVGVDCKFGPNDLGPSGSYIATSSGLDTDDASPSNVSWLIRKVTAGGGRPNRGRMYMPGLAEGEVDGAGLINPAKVTVIQTGIDSFAADLATGLLEPVVLHSAGSPVTIPTVITELLVDGRAATQRRRLRR